MANRNDPHLGLKFWVEIDGVEIAGFSECTGLSVSIEMEEISEGGWNVNVHKLPTRTKYENITLRRGLTTGAELFSWMEKGIQGAPAPRKQIKINIYDPAGKQVKQWVLRGAYPVRWSGPDLKSDAGAVALETLEFAHNGFLSMPNRK